MSIEIPVQFDERTLEQVEEIADERGEDIYGVIRAAVAKEVTDE